MKNTSALEQVVLERVAVGIIRGTRDGIEQVTYSEVKILTTVILGLVCETPLN